MRFWQSSPGLPVPLDQVCQSLSWTLKFPRTNTLAYGLIERSSSMLGEIESSTMHKDKEGDW